MKYRTLFSISIEHEYQGQGKWDGLELLPDPKCRRHLQNHRIRLRRLPGHWEWIFQSDSDNKPIVSLNDIDYLRFYLRLQDQKMLHYTRSFEEVFVQDFPEPVPLSKAAFKHWAFPRYSNEQTGDLTLSIFRYRTLEQHRVEDSNRFFLRGNPVPDRTAADFQLRWPDNTQEVTHYDPASKAVQVDLSSAPKGTQFYLSYWAVPPWPPYVFGLVDIHHSFQPGQAFRIALTAKKAYWKYYIVANSTDLTIEGSLPFATTPIPDDDEVAAGLRASFPDPDAKIILFTSAEELTYQNKMIKGIKLKENGTTRIEHLPNPSPGRQGVEIVNIYRKAAMTIT